MSKPVALFAFLWKNSLPALTTYLQRNERVVFVLADYSDEEAVKALESTGCQVKRVVIPSNLALQEGGRQSAAKAAAALKKRGMPGALAETVQSAGVLKLYENVLAQQLPSVYSLLNELQRINQEYFIEAALLSEESLWFGRTVAEWARQQGIPSIHLSHGTGILKNYNFEDYVCDTLAVFSERSVEAYLDCDVAAEKLVVVGNPSWDVYNRLRGQKSLVRQNVCKNSGLDPARPIIVFGTTWNAYLSTLDDRDLAVEIRDFLSVYGPLVSKGVQPQLVIKDRLATGKSNLDLVQEIARDLGVPQEQWRYELSDAPSWVAAADVVVSIDSNLAIEAILAETSAVNVLTSFGLLAGPGFGPEDPVLQCESENLAAILMQLLSDGALKQALTERMRQAAKRFNLGVDGNTTGRFAELIEKKRRALPTAAGNYVWQTLLNATDTDATQYHNWPRSELVDLALHAPRVVLDIGCAAGKTGEYIKQKFSQAKVYGIEQNRAAAQLAAQRLDSVFAGKFEDFDFAAHGIPPGSIDTVVVADVLEHIYSPWDVLVRLRPYLAPDAQILASIPNTRNLALMKDLAEGHWRYEAWGLLDVTHIRFFTLKEIRRFFHETGYHVARVHHNLDGRLATFYQQNQNKPLFNIDFDKFTLKNVNQEELAELCTIQFFVVAELGAVKNEEFEAQEKAREGASEARTAYERWCDARSLTKAQGNLYEQRMATWATTPVFHLAILTLAEDGERLGVSIQSLAEQYYHHLRLTVVSVTPPPAGWVDSERLAWRYAPESGLLECASRALLEGGGDWMGMIDAGDTVAPHSFLFLAEAVNDHPDWRFIYSDEDVRASTGKRDTPQFKPDFNLDLLRSTGYIGGMALVSRPLFERLGGFSSASKGAEDHDLALRAYEAEGAGAIGHIPDVLYHRREVEKRWRLSSGEFAEAGRRTVESHLARTKVAGVVEHGLFPGSYRVRYQHPAKPRVSILVAMRDQLEAVQRCVESVLATTSYLDYEVLIMDNGSANADSVAYLDGLKALGEERVRVYSCPTATNLPQLHNMLADESRGEYLLFLHFDSAVLQEDWLESLMAHGQRPEVGVVAPRLLHPDGTVAQAGLILGLNKTADTPFQGESLENGGYLGRAHLEQNFSALGGGCLLVRKSLFAEAGGFDAANFPADLAEVDLCQRIAGRGLLAVWTPFVNVLCGGLAHQHAWQGASDDEDAVLVARKAEVDHFYRQWLPKLARDPAYNVNLSLWHGKYFNVEANATVNWDPLPWRPLPRILAQPADNQGCGEYRIHAPLRALVDGGRVQGWSDFHIFSPPEMERLDVDSIILQRQTLPEQIEAISRHKKYSKALLVFELDDLLINLPAKSIHNTQMPKDIGKKIRQAVALCDRFVVSTEPLKEAYRDMHHDIHVVPNFLERARWGSFKPLRRQAVRPRVGWAGGIGHTGDLEMIASVVKELANEVDWVFFGMCPEALRPWIKEFHPGVPVEQYPAKLASLNLDLALAPLEHNRFNEAKSHLRLLEYGVLGYPVVCSDIYPYQGDYPVTRVRNRHRDWVQAIREHLADLDETYRQGDLLRGYVESRWMLEDNLDVWLQGWLP